MEKLKSVLADKIIDLSEGGGDDVKSKIEKIHNFRNFANACQTLIERYPTIEDEFIRMAQLNDFDTKVAASRVDSVIRLAQVSETKKTTDISELENAKASIHTESSDFYIDPTPIEEEIVVPEDVDYETIPLTDAAEKEYAEFHELTPSNDEQEESLSEDKIVKSKKDQAKTILIICGVILVGIVVFVVAKWFIHNWSIIRWYLLGILIVGVGGWILLKRNKKN